MAGSVAVGAAVFAIYALGACPTIYVGDSGELVTAVYVLGIPHPTGYPLYVLLGKVWTLALPVGSIAWRMSLFSAAWGGLACGLLHALCRRRGLHPIAAVVAALLLATVPSFWAEATVQRVYTMNAAFVVVATWLAWRWHDRHDTASLAAAFFTCGLGATNHAFMLVYALALALTAVVARPALLREPRRVAAAAGALLVGLLPYAYLPLRSRADPPLDWGNPETVHALLDVVLRRGFWTRAWIESPADLVPIALDWLRSFWVELGPAGCGLAALGLAGTWRRWPVPLFLLVMLGNAGAVALHGSRTDIFVWHRYYIPTYVVLVLFAGAGCDVVVRRLPGVLRVLPLAVPLAMMASGWPRFDRSRYRVADDFGRVVLRALPPGAHLAATDDNVLFTLLYLHWVEGLRPDVDLIAQGVGGATLPALRFDARTERLFLTHHPNWQVADLEVVPVGAVFEARHTGSRPPSLTVPPPTLAGEDDSRVPKDYLTQNLIGHYQYMRGVTAESTDWPAAAAAFARAERAAPDNDVLFYNLGLIYVRNGLFAEARDAFRRSAAINPRHLPSSKREHAADRIAELEPELRRLGDLERSLAGEPQLAHDVAGSPAWHGRMAELLDARGERLAARGHRLRAAMGSGEAVAR